MQRRRLSLSRYDLNCPSPFLFFSFFFLFLFSFFSCLESKAPFGSIEIDFRKSISGKSYVWLCRKIRSNWKHFQFDRKISLKRLKLVSVLIFTSIDFRNLSHTHKPLTRITALSSLHCAVKPSLRRNHPHRHTTIAIAISSRNWFVLLGFIWVFRNEWHYVFVWELRKCEKMWATSKKCVFYGIFKNTTKHQKIFSKNFFEMQPNTWKHFLFRKIAFPENIYFPEILLHEPNAGLAV